MVPITSQPPRANPFAVPVPEIEKRRAGLDLHLDLWIVADEANVDLPARSYHFEAGGRIGAFSPQFTKSIQARVIEALKARKLSRTSRR